MATNVRIIHARDCIRATADGALDLAASEQLLVDVATAARGMTDFDIIIDARRARATLTIADLWRLAHRLIRVPGMWKRKIAILPPTEDFHRAAFFALVAENRGALVQAFPSFEEAIDWLSGASTEATR